MFRDSFIRRSDWCGHGYGITGSCPSYVGENRDYNSDRVVSCQNLSVLSTLRQFPRDCWSHIGRIQCFRIREPHYDTSNPTYGPSVSVRVSRVSVFHHLRLKHGPETRWFRVCYVEGPGQTSTRSSNQRKTGDDRGNPKPTSESQTTLPSSV